MTMNNLERYLELAKIQKRLEDMDERALERLVNDRMVGLANYLTTAEQTQARVAIFNLHRRNVA